MEVEEAIWPNIGQWDVRENPDQDSCPYLYMFKMVYISNRQWAQLYPHNLTNTNWGRIHFLEWKSRYIFGKGFWEGNLQGSL